MTSSANFADHNGNIFSRTICPLSFVVIALIFSELRGGGGIPPPGPTRPKKPVGVEFKNKFFLDLNYQLGGWKLVNCPKHSTIIRYPIRCPFNLTS